MITTRSVREFDVCRRLTVASTALTIGGVLVLAPLLLPLLGNYGGARVLMVLLAIPAIVQAFYATVGPAVDHRRAGECRALGHGAVVRAVGLDAVRHRAVARRGGDSRRHDVGRGRDRSDHHHQGTGNWCISAASPGATAR